MYIDAQSIKADSLFHETTKAIGLQKVIYSEKYISTPYKKYTGKNIYFICYHPIHIQLIGLWN